MKILYVIHRYYPGCGGAEEVMAGLAERFSRDGDSVTVVTTDAFDFDYCWDKSLRRVPRAREIYKGVNIERYRIRHLPMQRKITSLLGKLPFFWSKVAFDRPSIFAPGMMSLLWRRQAFDIVQAGVSPYNFPMYVAMRYARRYRLPLIIYACVHIGEYHKKDRLGDFYTRDYQCRILNSANKVIVHSRAEGDYLVEKGIGREKIFLWPPGIEPGELEGGDGERFRKKYNLNGPIVFQISVQAHDKGSPYLVEAMKLLWKKGLEANLVFAGTINEDFRRYLKTWTEEVKKRCLVLGVISQEEKKDLLAAGDIMVMASRTDSFGIVYLESWFYGKPVIGARAGGVPEVIRDGLDGYLVPFGDTKQLSECIFRLIKNEDFRRQLGERGKAKVLKDYTWEKVYQEMRRLYQELVYG